MQQIQIHNQNTRTERMKLPLVMQEQLKHKTLRKYKRLAGLHVVVPLIHPSRLTPPGIPIHNFIQSSLKLVIDSALMIS